MLVGDVVAHEYNLGLCGTIEELRIGQARVTWDDGRAFWHNLHSLRSVVRDQAYPDGKKPDNKTVFQKRVQKFCAFCRAEISKNKYCSPECADRAREKDVIERAENLYKNLISQGFPEFEKYPEYEVSVFILTEENRGAYEIIHEAAKHIYDSVEEETGTAVYGKVGFDIWASPAAFSEATALLTELGVSDAQRYVKIGKGTHHIKFNLCLPNAASLVGLNHRLQTNILHARKLSNHRPDIRTVQIGKRSLCEQLIRDGILPEEIQ